MARRSDHSREEIKEFALAATEKIVAERGFAALSARKIATEIGYTVGTLYLVFQNLDDLIMQVNNRTLTKLEANLRQILKNNLPRENLHKLGSTYYEFATKNQNLWSLIFEHHVAGGGDITDDLANRITMLFSLIETELNNLDELNDKTSIHRAALALWSSVHGITILAVSDKLFMAKDVTPPELIERLIDNFLIGYLAKETA